MRDTIWEALRLVNENYNLEVDFDNNWDEIDNFIEGELLDIMYAKLEKIKGEK